MADLTLYRGQAYGAPVGEWWTIDLDEARQYARARHARSWVVLAIDVDAESVEPFALDAPFPTVFRVPASVMGALNMAASVVAGCLYLEERDG